MIRQTLLISALVLAPLTRALATLPYLENYEFSPQVATVLYGSPSNKYKLMAQFVGSDPKNIQGRFCEIDDNGRPFNCVSVNPNLKDRTCTLSSYNERSFAVPDFKLSNGDVSQMFFDNFLSKADQKLASSSVQKVQVGNLGSARVIGVPAPTVIPYVLNIEDARNEWWKNISQPTAESIYRAKLACHLFYENAGVAVRFENARKINFGFCEAYNESADDMNATRRNCNVVSGQSHRPLTPSKAAN